MKLIEVWLTAWGLLGNVTNVRTDRIVATCSGVTLLAPPVAVTTAFSVPAVVGRTSPPWLKSTTSEVAVVVPSTVPTAPSLKVTVSLAAKPKPAIVSELRLAASAVAADVTTGVSVATCTGPAASTPSPLGWLLSWKVAVSGPATVEAEVNDRSVTLISPGPITAHVPDKPSPRLLAVKVPPLSKP